MIALEWLPPAWRFGADDLFRFRVQAWRLSVSWDRVPVSNMLRGLRNQIRLLKRQITEKE